MILTTWGKLWMVSVIRWWESWVGPDHGQQMLSQTRQWVSPTDSAEQSDNQYQCCVGFWLKWIINSVLIWKLMNVFLGIQTYNSFWHFTDHMYHCHYNEYKVSLMTHQKLTYRTVLINDTYKSVPQNCHWWQFKTQLWVSSNPFKLSLMTLLEVTYGHVWTALFEDFL